MAEKSCKCGTKPKAGQPDGFIIRLGDLYGYTPSNNNSPQSLYEDAKFIAQRFPNEGWDDPGKIIYLNTTKNFCETSNPDNFGDDSPYGTDPSLSIRLKTYLYNKWLSSCTCKSCDPDFTGGQCGINYIVTYKITNMATNLKTGQVVSGGFNQVTQVAVFPGAIRYFGRKLPDSNGTEKLEVGCQNPTTGKWTLINIISNVGWSSDYGFKTLSCQVISVKPQNPVDQDNCGNPDPLPEPDPIPPGGTVSPYLPDPAPIPPNKDSLGGGGTPMPEPTTAVTVPIAVCSPDGSAQTSNTSITVPESQATAWAYLFGEIAAVKANQCKLLRWSERTYNIFDGDGWFPNANTRSPSRDFNAESVIRQYGGIAKLSDQCPQTESNKVFSLIGMLNAMAAVDYYRSGFNHYPIEVPMSLLDYQGTDQSNPLKSEALVWEWWIKQFDAIIGRFPIEIEIQDTDPLTEGDQSKRIEFPNLAEAITETYGLLLMTATNSDLSINFLVRLATEIIGTKNAVLVTQDYAKANADFLGYKGNTAKKEVPYAFNPQITDDMAGFLSSSVAIVAGWQNEQKDNLIAYLQRLMFAAGIIKAVFFRNKKQIPQLQNELSSFLEAYTGAGGKEDDAEWQRFIKLMNDSDAFFNKGDYPNPEIDKKSDAGTQQ